MSRTRFLILAAVLLGGIGLTFGRVGDPFRNAGYRPLTEPFESFPREIVDANGTIWQGRDEALSRAALDRLRVDRWLRRVYRAGDGRAVQIFVGYHGNLEAGLSTIYHNPTICFPSQGWEMTGEERVLSGDEAVTRYRFVNDGREQVVYNYFVLNGRRVARSPREDPLEIARVKLSMGSGPGYYAQVQVVGVGSDGGAMDFLTAAAGPLFEHF